MITIDEILSENNQKKAFEHLKTKRDSCGIDGMRLSELEEYWKLNGENICEQIRKQEYKPGIVLIKQYLNKKGKRRNISCMNSIDRFVTRLLAQNLRTYIEPQFLPNSYAYQEGKGTLAALLQVKSYVEAGYKYMVEIDIKDYFESIFLPLLLKNMQNKISDFAVLGLLKKYLYCTISQDGNIQKKTKGILTGNAISPILSNIYLHDFDQNIEKQGFKWIRFADNIYIFSYNFDDAIKIYNQVSSWLSEQFYLEINLSKSGVFKVCDRIILGYDIIKKGRNVDIRKHVYRERNCFLKWHDSRMEMSGGKYHIITDGIINREDYSILFENESKKHFIPVEVTNQINIYSNVTLASNVLNKMNEKNIKINFFDRRGRLIGCFVPEKTCGYSNILLKQCELYLDEHTRLDIAQQMEIASLHNIRSNLRYYEKHENGVYDESIKRISELIVQENNAKTINQLMLIEAQARQIYYRMFSNIIKDEQFKFTIRTKRPPRDSINACISFGNTLLYNEFLSIIWMKGLHPGIGMLHAANRRNYSLNLDFADIFKPIISDRVIFTLLNRKMISLENFEEYNKGIYLTKYGKKIFLEQFEKKLNEALVIKGKKYTYRELMILEVQNFKNAIVKKEKYRPYKYY